jgi:hypothetical protein
MESKTGGSKPQDLTKITRYLNERINFCIIKDNRQTKETYKELLNKFEAGAFEFDTENRDYRQDITEGKRFGFCNDCINLMQVESDSCNECFESHTKCNYKPKKVPEVQNKYESEIKMCDNCPHKREVRAVPNFTFWGCYCNPYKGKWIIEIKECPKNVPEV